MKLVLLLRSPRWRKRGMWMTNGCWTTLISNLWAGLNPEPSLVPDHKEVLDQTIYVTTADFKGTLDQIVKSWEQWIMQVLQGLEDLEMTGEIRLVNRQEVEMVIPKRWTWWRWLVHSPTAWKASHEGLKTLTLVPNPIRISPQTQVTCGWKRVLMHKHYNMSMHQYFLCFVTLFGCFLINYVIWNLFVCFCILSYKLFSLLRLINLFILMCQKSKNHIKSRKSKVWLTLLSCCLKTCFALYLCANGFVHLPA